MDNYHISSKERYEQTINRNAALEVLRLAKQQNKPVLRKTASESLLKQKVEKYRLSVHYKKELSKKTNQKAKEKRYGKNNQT